MDMELFSVKYKMNSCAQVEQISLIESLIYEETLHTELSVEPRN
jgi:hypothetical protein